MQNSSTSRNDLAGTLAAAIASVSLVLVTPSCGTSSAGSDDTSVAGGGGVAPTVQAESTYEVAVTTETYGKGQRHLAWNGPTDGVRDLLLDVYEPVDAPPGRPAVVVIHGGGFTGGSRTNENSVAFAQHFAQRGFVAVSIDYRVTSDRGTLPQAWIDVVAASDASQSQRLQALGMYAAARDAKAAVRWFVTNADTYQIDTDHITAIGGSAGSYLAIMLGVTNPEDFRDEVSMDVDPTLATTNLTASAEVHTIIDHWGGITHMEILERMNGKSRFDESDAPVSIVHGTADETVPFTEAEKLRDAYTATGVAFDFHPLEGAGHGPWDATVDGKDLRELAFDFVVENQGLDVTP